MTALGLALFCGSAAADPAQTITIAPASPSATNNCYPFGLGGTDAGLGADWKPFMGFVYKNVPAFELKTGDILAFDLSAQNDANIGMDIALARTTANGNDVNAQPFIQVVANTQAPANPRGDSTVGDYELGFVAQAPFSFPGGGLIIRFSNPSPTFLADNACTNVDTTANSTDPSGFFVERFFNDSDGVAPWSGPPAGFTIAGFQLMIGPTTPGPTGASNAFTFGKTKDNKKKGTATITVNVPGPGTLDLAGKGVKPQRAPRASRASVSRAVGKAGPVKLLVKPKGKTKHKLTKKGKAKVKVSVTYTPTGGSPKTHSESVKLVKRP